MVGRRAGALVVNGRLVISAAIPPFQAAARIWLEDVSVADAAATVVAETVVPDIRHGQSGKADTEIPFELRVPAGVIDPRNDYAVSAWVDRDGDGKESCDDLYSERSYRVLTRGFGRGVTVTLGRH